MKSSFASFAVLICLSMIGLATLTSCHHGTNGQYNGGQPRQQQRQRPNHQNEQTTESSHNVTATVEQEEAEQQQPTGQVNDSRPIRKQYKEKEKLQRELRALRYQVIDKERELDYKLTQIVWRAAGVEQLNADLATTVDNKNEEIRSLKEQLRSMNCITDRSHGFVPDKDDLHDDCKHPVDTGDCKGSFLRYFYDGQAGACKQFEWGGCEDSPNNFVSMAECERKCRTRD